MKRRFILLFLCVLPLITIAQVDELLCQVLDSQTNQPVVFATILVKTRSVGVISDDNGNFRLPFRYKTNKDIIRISCIGYKTIEINVASLKDTELNVFKLVPKIEALDAVTIVAQKNRPAADRLQAREIIRRAIANIRQNYPTSPHSYIGYYRDYQLLNKTFFNLNEGIMEEFDAGFQTNKIFYKDNQAVLYSFKQNDAFPKDSLLTQAYDNSSRKFMEAATLSGFGGNELSILNIHNAIRHYEKKSFSFANVFKEDFIVNHTFLVTDKMYLDDQPIYRITFFANEDVTGVKNSANGVIYVGYDTYAIHKLEYNGYQFDDPEPFYSVTVEYKPLGDKMYLNYISFFNEFKVKSANSFKMETIEYDPSINAFIVKFNNPVDEKTIVKKRRFKLEYYDERLKIDAVKLISPRRLQISIADRFGEEDLANFTTMTGLEYKIRGVTDLAGRKLDELVFLDVDQYREFFVQQVFTEKTLPEDLIFVSKAEMLKDAKINDGQIDKETYWINSPLKTIKD